MESMRHKAEIMMRTGDVADGGGRRRPTSEIDELCVYAKKLMAEGMTIKQAAKEVGVQTVVLRRRLDKK